MAVTLALVEGLALFGAIATAIAVSALPTILDWLDVVTVLTKASALSACCITALYYNDVYNLRVVRRFTDFLARLIPAFGVAFLLLAALYTVAPDVRIGDAPFVWGLVLVLALLLPIRAAAYAIMRRERFNERVVILGTGPMAQRLAREIEEARHFRYRIVGVVDDGSALDGDAWRYPVHGPLERMGKIIADLAPSRIIVALGERRGRMPVRDLLDARMAGVRIDDGIDLYERLTGKVAIETMTPSHMIFSDLFTASAFQLGVRRGVSVVLALVGLVAAAPLMALTALIVKLESPGPLFFRQERAGLRGRLFTLIKFRTMRDGPAGGDQSVWARNDEARITRAGRFIRKLRLDELPQFWNILRGDMDFVGPRPEMRDNVATMSEEIPFYALRLAVRPGVTGWAQVHHGYAVSRDDVIEKIRYDLYYVKYLSLALDLRIVVDTVKIVLLGRGAR